MFQRCLTSECILILIVERKCLRYLIVKERSELAMISSSQTASESMRRSAPFISLRLLATDKFSSSVDESD